MFTLESVLFLIQNVCLINSSLSSRFPVVTLIILLLATIYLRWANYSEKSTKILVGFKNPFNFSRHSEFFFINFLQNFFEIYVLSFRRTFPAIFSDIYNPLFTRQRKTLNILMFF